MSLPCTVTGEGVGEGSRKGWPVVSRQEEALGEEREEGDEPNKCPCEQRDDDDDEHRSVMSGDAANSSGSAATVDVTSRQHDTDAAPSTSQ
jgi:hypothetical protein